MRNQFVRSAGLVAALVTAVSLVACGEDRDDTGTTGTGTEAEETTPAPTGTPTATVKVKLGEYFIQTDRPSVEAGTIRFEVVNEGTVEHEFEVVKTDEAPGALPVTDEDKADVEAVGEALGEIEPFPKGETEELTLELEPGKHVFICNIESHYARGQYAGFTVR